MSETSTAGLKRAHVTSATVRNRSWRKVVGDLGKAWCIGRLVRCVARIVTGSACLLVITAGSTIAEPLKVADLLTMRQFAPHTSIALSSDGQLVSYALSRPHRAEMRMLDDDWYTATGAPRDASANDIWFTDTQTGESRNLTDGIGANWGPAWSPNGRLLAFYSDRGGKPRLWVWNRDSDALHEVSDVTIRTLHDHSPQWMPDGTAVLAGVIREGAKSGSTDIHSGSVNHAQDSGRAAIQHATVRVFHSRSLAGEQYTAPRIDTSHLKADLALIDVSSGTVRRVAEQVHAGKALISPNGEYIVFVNIKDETAPSTHTRLTDLTLIGLTDGKVRTLVSRAILGNYGHDISWAPDSRTVAYRAGGHESSDAFLVSLTGAVRPLTQASHPPFTGTPVWDDEGQFVYLTSEDAIWRLSIDDGAARQIARLVGKSVKAPVTTSTNRDRVWLRRGGRAIVLVATDESHEGFYEVALESGTVRTLMRQERHFVLNDPSNAAKHVVASSQSRIVFVAEDAQRPADLWVAGGELRHAQQLTFHNPAISAVRMGKRRIVEWTGRDRQLYHGIVILPSDYQLGQRYPMVTFVYPVKTLPHANMFGGLDNAFYNLQLLATRGYAVLFAGATLHPNDGEPMKAVADAVLPGIDHLVEQGVADPERLGVYGVSAGGYCTLALIVQSSRFRAAMAHGGSGNLLSAYGDLQDNGYSHGLALSAATFHMPNHPWKDRERYIRNSPWFFLDKVETPLLLLHGTDDTATIVTQANELFVGLRRLGKEAEYARYEGEGHGFSAFPNAVDAATRYIEWFDRHLKRAE